MKLLTKTTLYFLTIALFVLFAGGIIFYFSFRYMINHEVNKELLSEMHQLILNPRTTDSMTLYLPFHYTIVPSKEVKNATFVFSDTLLYDRITGDYQSYRMLSYKTKLDGEPVMVSISKSMMAFNDLIEYVVFVVLGLSLFLLLLIVILNNFFFSRVWSGFFKTIDIMNSYNISETGNIPFEETEITEFNQLNNVFRKMNERIKLDYQNLKEFIGIVSHEIQNPLAIIRSKIELLQQEDTLTKSNVELVQSIQSNTIRLSNLNKSLILLAKIDNNQFPEKEQIDVVENVNFHLDSFEEIILAKKITVKKSLGDKIIVTGDQNLVSLMLLNLLKNSVYHNNPSGTIEISTDANTLTIKNSGKDPGINTEYLFQRFVKSSGKPDSLGLGLAIVKKICDYYDFKVRYVFKDSFHVISIDF